MNIKRHYYICKLNCYKFEYEVVKKLYSKGLFTAFAFRTARRLIGRIMNLYDKLNLNWVEDFLEECESSN